MSGVRQSHSKEPMHSNIFLKNSPDNQLKVGIQGGAGSFNEQAAMQYLKLKQVADFEISYLYTTSAVLGALSEGKIDCGQFAISNTIGGVVEESILAMADHIFKIIDSYTLKIEHALLIKKGASIDQIEVIMTHPQVLKQCEHNLAANYPQLRKTSGTGDMLDSARVAEAISNGELAASYAAMGSPALAEIYDLQIESRALQDRDDNFTRFLWVEPETREPCC